MLKPCYVRCFSRQESAVVNAAPPTEPRSQSPEGAKIIAADSLKLPKDQRNIQ